ncbi:cellulose biosynthesis protein BcsO [Sodalis sp. dw_96]|uniref:cellulose biosynthesis protein BcsO n=1 Tax=Sodalis sp. dw_96 TaxID=2719794 RepID=UPI001BD32779|nr:cellulose biosynthesis protein BcsO [Sodalis sp. dw_96]
MNNYDDIKRFKEKLNLEGIDYKEITENNPHNTPHNWAILKQIAAADEPFHPLEQGLTTQPVPVQVSNKEFIASAFDKPAAVQPSQNAGKNEAPVTPAAAYASPLMAAVSKVLSSEQGAGYAANEMLAAVSSPLNGPGQGQPVSRPSILDGVGRGLPIAGPTDVNATARREPAAAPASPLRSDNGHTPVAAGASIFDSIGRHEPAPAPASPMYENNGRPQPAAGASIFDSMGRRGPAAAPAQEKRFNNLFNRKSQLTTGVVPGRDMPLSLLLENIALCR